MYTPAHRCTDFQSLCTVERCGSRRPAARRRARRAVILLTGSRRCFGRRFALLVCARAESVCDRSACCSVRDRRTVRRRGDMAPRPFEIRARAKNARALFFPPRAFPRPATVRARPHARTYSTNQCQPRGRRSGIRATAAAASTSDRVSLDSICFFFRPLTAYDVRALAPTVRELERGRTRPSPPAAGTSRAGTPCAARFFKV